MKVLVIGGGGREHALVWKLRQSARVSQLYCAPGNPGIAGLATCVPLAAEKVSELADFAAATEIDLTVVGPEVPLALGLVDEFKKRELLAFGPSRLAAQLESSKIFAKEFMLRHGIPTPAAEVARNEEEARAAAAKIGLPLVLMVAGTEPPIIPSSASAS